MFLDDTMAAQKILITNERIPLEVLKRLCERWFGDMVKVVVDVETKWVGVGGELHADGEALLMQNGSRQENLWGANVYPQLDPPHRIEYTALVNIRPRQDNPSMEILDEAIRAEVRRVIETLVIAPDEEMV